MTGEGKRCVIIGGAPVGEKAVACCNITTDDYIIAADRGYLTALELDLTPHLIVGDFDSAPPPQSANVLIHSSHKDDTDSLLAVKEGLARGFREFLILGGTGGRFDHTFANLQTLLYLKGQGGSGKILDEEHTIYLLMDESCRVPYFEGFLSIFAMAGSCTVTMKGMEYPLTDYLLTPSYPLGVSNRIREPYGTVATRGGALLIVEYRGPNGQETDGQRKEETDAQ